MLKTAIAILTLMHGFFAFTAHAANYAGLSFCGGTVTPGDPTDMENQVGEMTLQAAVDQPASMTTCGKGYLLAKCGDHENANTIFDRCIAAGYVGAMIWKALQLENGNGTKQDFQAAADLLRRAAQSSDMAYGPIGRLHYATVLHEGRGVAQDKQEALKWFRQAAAEGSEEAQEFLRTGYHSGARDSRGLGAGTPTTAALAPLLQMTDETERIAPLPLKPGSSASENAAPVRAIALTQAAAAMPLAPVVAVEPMAAVAIAAANRDEPELRGLLLDRAQSPVPPAPAGAGGVAWILLAAFLLGWLFQRPATTVRVRAHSLRISTA